MGESFTCRNSHAARDSSSFQGMTQEKVCLKMVQLSKNQTQNTLELKVMDCIIKGIVASRETQRYYHRQS